MKLVPESEYVNVEPISPDRKDKISKRSDTWNLGIILLDLCTLGDTLKFQTVQNWSELRYNIVNYEFKPDIFKQITSEKYNEFTIKVLKILLEPDYKFWPSISELLPILKGFKNYLDGGEENY